MSGRKTREKIEESNDSPEIPDGGGMGVGWGAGSDIAGLPLENLILI